MIASNDWILRNSLYLNNPLANSAVFNGFKFYYPPARIPLYTLRPFGTTHGPRSSTVSTTTRINTETDGTDGTDGTDYNAEEFIV